MLLHSQSVVYDVTVAGSPPDRAGPGAVVVVPAGVEHRIACPRPGVLTAAHVRYRLPGGADPMSLHVIAPVRTGPVAAAIGRALQRLAATDPRTVAGAAAQQAAGLEILGLVLADAPPLPDGTRRVLAQAQVGAALAAMQASPSRPWTPAGLARACQLSRAHFCRAFRLATGQTPMAWLQQVRLVRACELLRDERRSIGAIAEAVGFCDPFHFSRVFTRAHGLSPRQWRLRATVLNPPTPGAATASAPPQQRSVATRAVDPPHGDPAAEQE